MKKKLLSLLLCLTLAAAITGCKENETSSSTSSKTETTTEATTEPEESAEPEVISTAVDMSRAGNPGRVSLNAEGILDSKTNLSWVKITTIWDPDLILYNPEDYVADSKGVVTTFSISGLDVESTKCYWNYMVVDSKGTEINCWDETYLTDDLEITADGTYQMVFDYSKVNNGDVAGINSLQLVFTNMSDSTAAKFETKSAKYIVDAEEIGSIYTTGIVEE